MEYLAVLIAIPVIFAITAVPGQIAHHRSLMGTTSFKTAGRLQLAGIAVGLAGITAMLSLL